MAVPITLGNTVLKHAWFQLARIRLIKPGKPVSRMIDDCPIVLWRDDTGIVRAMENRCVHRRAALSAGKIVNGNLQCPYHGWQHDTTGACVHIPSLDKDAPISAQFCVDAYSVVARYGWAWVWWGDPSAADESLIPDIPFLDPALEAPGGRLTRFSYKAPQELVVENLLDLTHLDFVHGAIFGDPFGAGDEQILVDHTDEVITMTRISEQRLPPKPRRFSPRDSGRTSTRRCRSTSAPALRSVSPGPRHRRPDVRADKSVPADAPGLRYRAMRRALIERQRNGDFNYAEGWQGPDPAGVHRVARP